MRLPARRLGSLLAVAACTWVAVGGARGDEPRAAMHDVFAAIAELLPLALEDARFASAEERERIAGLLDSLAEAVDVLEAHARTRDVGFQFLSRSLGEDVQEARARFALGRTEGARYFVIESSRKCIACHERLPASRDFPLGRRLLDNADLDALSPSERARLSVVGRRFGDALDLWEARFADPAVAPGRLDSSGDLLDYLTVVLRVEQDTNRARRTLRKLGARPDLPGYLRRHIAAWLAALDRFDAMDDDRPALDRARELIGALPTENPRAGQERLVADLLASGLLLRFIDQRDPGDPVADVAEAYYLLGGVEARTVEAFWVPQSEFHLAASIRLAPGGPHASRALSLLRTQYELGYGGSSGVHLPQDVWATLRELETLIAEATPNTKE